MTKNGANENNNEQLSKQLSKQLSDNSSSNESNVKLYYYYMNNCSWCEKFKPVWDELNKKTDYKFHECEKNELENDKKATKIQKALNLKITSFPSIFIKINRDYYKYEGERTLEKILEFIENILIK